MRATLFIFILCSLCLAGPGRVRMTISFRYQGERLEATFITNIHGYTTVRSEQPIFTRLAEFLDGLRLERYAGKRMSDEEKAWLKKGFFSHEALSQHDEILVLHRGMDLETSSNNGPSGLGPEILGITAVDRLGHPKPTYHSEYRRDDYEKLMLERRLSELGIAIPRPKPVLWEGEGLPPGVYPHWDVMIGPGFFEPGHVFLGDVIQVNGFFADEGLAPLLYTLANRYGLFSTGRIVYFRGPATIEGVEIPKRSVLVPTLVVWETFNKLKDGKRKVGLRTRYYGQTGAVPLEIDGVDEWVDPTLGPNTLVQILSKTGDAFRTNWLPQLRFRDLTPLNSIVVEQVCYEPEWNSTLNGGFISPDHQSFTHHPRQFTDCALELTK